FVSFLENALRFPISLVVSIVRSAPVGKGASVCQQRSRSEPLSQSQLSHSAVRRSRLWLSESCVVRLCFKNSLDPASSELLPRQQRRSHTNPKRERGSDEIK